jgi:hypothetical protein
VRGKNEDLELEKRLRGLHEEPSDALLEALAARVGARQSHAWSKAAFLAAVVTVVLGTFASFGGVGYAAAGADQALNTVAHSAVVQSSADRQYKPKHAVHVGATAGVTVQAAPPVKAQTLPFTGLSLVWTAIAGFAMLLLGIALRRREQRR